MAGSYVEFTVNVTEETGTDSSSYIDKKVRDSSNKSDDKKELEKQAKKQMEENKPDNDNKESKTTKALKQFLINDIAKQGIQTGIKVAQDIVTQKAIYSGNTAEANRISNITTKVSGISGTVSNIIGGITGGAAIGGGVGAAIGGVISAVTEIVDLVLDYNKRDSEFQFENQAVNMEGQRKARRLGVLITDRGRG